MNDATMAKAFNEWMREYTEDPDSFQSEWASVREFLAETADGREPSYGEQCVALLKRYASKVEQAG